MGQVVTFYSYKGGVGRSMALANVAVILAQWGHNVLIVDWDLEAPGIEIYFKPYLGIEAVTHQEGVVDLLWSAAEPEKSEGQKNWRDFLVDVQVPEVKGRLHLLTAGQRDDEYFRKVRSLDLHNFYYNQQGGLFVESLRNEWKEDYDYVLVDSRTGITDIGGICTIQLPDMLVLMFTATDQALTGALEVAEKARIAQQALPFDRLSIVSVPIPSRFDTQTEFKISQEWLERFSSELAELYADWLPTSVTRRDILELTKFPYVPYFSFGERLPVLEHGTNDPAGLGYAYETLAALLANNLESVELLIEDREDFVRSAVKKRVPQRPLVLVSYSHRDEDWKDRLVTHLGVLHHQGLLDLWDDRRIGAGHDWYSEIQRTLDDTSVVVLLVSANFLTSQFILGEEMPRLLERRDKEGLRIFPVIVKPCAWKQVKWLARMQVRPKDGRPLSAGDEHQIDADLAAVAEEVAAIIRRAPRVAPPEGYAPLGPEKISLAKLPSTSADLFGREKELAMLDAAWENPQSHVVILVAWGGVGKTALVNKHLLQMGEDNYRGAERVYGWSFYSQGAREGGQASADPFIAAALEWFGDPDPTKGSPWDKGERLAELVKQQPTILILDGLEPLQYPPGEMGGRLKDPALCCLLRALARHNPGLCLITTRLLVDDLKKFIGTSVECIHLEHLSPEAGAAYLVHLGITGTPEELKQAVGEFEGHALALTLLGSYLMVVYNGDIRQCDKIARLIKERKQGGHARRVMESYERWFQGQPELDILRMMGLFDRPAEGGAIEALRAEPAIPGLTSELQGLSHEDWQYAVGNLRAARLLAGEDPHQPDTLDCHPLVREHFGEKLQESTPEAWKEAHSRLYEYYKSQAPEYPDTIEEMAPLYAAVAHGCQADRYQEALDEVYRRRIQRGNEFFNAKKLGALGAELAALSGFFDQSWRRPVAGLTEATKAFVLNGVGFDLQALGRLAEAAQPMQAALEARLVQEDWENAAIAASNLSQLYLTLGYLAQALEAAQQSVDLADRSGDAFERMSKRTRLADALHQAGRLQEAAAAFREAEEMQKVSQPQFLFLYSLQGFQYCDLLLDQGKVQEVQSRAGKTLDWAQEYLGLLDIALDHLSLGQAHLLQAQQEGGSDYAQAAAYLERAVNGLRQAGAQEFIVRGLLARAELRRVTDSLERAQADLEEALSIATRGGMRLFEADCHLEYARLHLACGEKEKARQSLAQAKDMIQEMGYHRRDGEVAELEEIMNQDSGHGRTRTNTE
jgi:tetratricopeptide (TPR) repeat protein/CO dehydrogenase nickel-insertion accessory protein CooC1